ncbi:MAG TPA: penicillin-binding protein 2, partial [Chromatiales bacterium]|nr:penicillin-binding protein 2 [Chromatiales bacterium]
MTRRRDKGLRFSRRHFVVGVLLAGMTALAARSVHLQVLDREFLREEGDARHLRVVKMSAHRGMITDRNGEPLAISTPVDSVWANPGELMSARERLPELARLLGVPADDLWQTIASRADREFVYLRRHINPDLGRRVLALELPG